jgi:hypothetical protein
MEKPDLHHLWETFIEIPVEGGVVSPSDVVNIYRLIRSKIAPMIVHLREEHGLGWYCWLIHNRRSGVPTTEGDDNPYFHVRLEFADDVTPEDFLPDCCVMTRKIRREDVTSIAGISRSLLKNEEIEEAWRMIGGQSEWLLNLFRIHKEDADIPPEQIGQFLHFFANMTCVAVR